MSSSVLLVIPPAPQSHQISCHDDLDFPSGHAFMEHDRSQMDFPLSLRLTARQYNRPDSISKAPCSSYHAPYPSIALSSKSGHTMPRHSSLPSLHARMFFTDATSRGNREIVKRSDSNDSLRRSVPSMKSLLPLKLSSSFPNSASNSPPTVQRSTFGCQEKPDNVAIEKSSTHSSKRKFNVSPTVSIRRFRDTPVYTEAGSPLLNLAFYTDDEKSQHSSSVYSLSGGSFFESDESEDEGSETLDEERPLPGQSMRINWPSRSSDLSFQCLGESDRPFQPLFHDEGAWLSSPLNKWNCPQTSFLPRILAESTAEHDIEGWLSDTSSICEHDFYACATALAPARATVIDVSSTRLSIKIPPRSSSLVETRAHLESPSGGRKSRMTVRDSVDMDSFDQWDEADFLNAKKAWLSQSSSNSSSDLSMPSPPLSVINLESPSEQLQKIDSIKDPTPGMFYEDESPSISGGNTTARIVSALNDAMSTFPPNALNLETPCISSMRSHLRQPSPPPFSQPPPPLSPFSEGVDWRPYPETSPSSRRPKTSYLSSLHRTLSSRTSKTAPFPKGIWNIAQQTSQSTHMPPNDYNPCPSEPDLQPFEAIFPSTPQQLRSVLYAHILAFLFMKSLLEGFATQSQTPSQSPLHHLPYHSTTSLVVPRKAADRLGMIVPELHRKINVGEDAILLRQSGGAHGTIHFLEGKLRDRIGWLVTEMRCGNQVYEKKSDTIDAAFLRALGEIVKSCERECFGCE